MLPGRTGRRNVATVLLTFVLLASCFGTAIGSTPASAPGAPSAVEPSTPGASPADTGDIHPDLEDASGEVTVVVRFSGHGAADEAGGSPRERGTRMRSHAAATQTVFEAFVAEQPGVTVERSFWVANAKLVTVDTDAVALAELAAVDGVREIHPNYRIEASSTASNSTATPSASPAAGADSTTTGDGPRTTYGLRLIRAPRVWERFGTRGGGVSVAVLDSGVDPSHPDVDVPPERWAEFDGAGERVDSTPYDSDGHGTHTSGTVAGGDASGTHIGVAPGATLYHGKVLDGDDGTWAAIIAGIEWAATEAEVDVITMSLGAERYHSAFVDPIRRANDLGVVVVASAGNTDQGASNSPGNSYDTLAAGAVDENRTVASSSGGERVVTAEAWGSAAPDRWPDEYVVPSVVAPGVDVLSAEPGGGYGRRNGTSMAAPHVAGVVALVRAAGGDHLSQDEMRDLLERTARDPAGTPAEKDTRYGAGVVDAYAATALGAADSAVTGRVVDADGDPVAGARVETEFGYGTTTGADGSYRLEVPSLDQTLTVEADGYGTATVTVAPSSETRRRDVVLSVPSLETGPAIEPETEEGADAGSTGSVGGDSASGDGGVSAEPPEPASSDDEPAVPGEAATTAGSASGDAAPGSTTTGRATPTLGDGAGPGVGITLLAALAGALAARRWPR
jgi:subtilisin family serine protease